MTNESLKFYDKYIALPTTLIYSALLTLCTDMLPTDRRKAPPKPRQRGFGKHVTITSPVKRHLAT